MKLIARLWRRLFPRPEPTPETPKAPEAAPGLSWRYALIGSDEGDAPNPERGYRLPTVLPGVRPDKPPTGDKLTLAFDGGHKEELATDSALPLAWGSFGDGGAIGPGVAFLGFPYLAELAQITEYRTPAETLSTEMTRRWLKLVNKGNDQTAMKLTKIEARLDELNVRDLFREAAFKCEQFGRAHIYVRVKNQGDDNTRQTPLQEIEKGTLEGFSCIEAYWLTPYSWNSTQPERPDFYKPQSWYVLGRKTHHTRLLTFIFREVPDLLKPAYDFAGISITQLMMPYVNRWLRTAKSVNDLINIFSIVNLATDLTAMLQAAPSDPKSLFSRLKAFVATRDNKGVMVTNKSTEEVTIQDASLAGLDKLQAQAQEHMATPGRMPLIKFFGITPSGLNATSEGEFQNWYAYVKGMQELGFNAHIIRVLELVQMDLFGNVDDDIKHEWQPLFEPTGKELAEIRKSDADRDGVYVEKGVVDADEIRDKLRKDPESGYNNLVGPAPEPVVEVEAGLQEEGKQADHERGEESAEAAHERTEASAEKAHERQKELDVDTGSDDK
jgi:phage-related protein (TIGR01555 family)